MNGLPDQTTHLSPVCFIMPQDIARIDRQLLNELHSGEKHTLVKFTSIVT